MIYDSRFSIGKRTVPLAAANRQLPIGNRQSQRGVALIITLIMLAVITFMATTFLVLSRRERNAVTTTTDQTTARFAADSALERAKLELLAGILSTTNDQNFDLMVPTNYFRPDGFISGLPAGYDGFTNVNYWYPNGAPLVGIDFLSNLTNLFYNPRPPVFVTNRITGGTDFRYYLDLNRNGRFDPSGVISNVVLGLSGYITNGNISAIGDPQWIGVPRFPDRPYSADNPFVARWTYLVVPADKTLDVNYIHNEAVTRNVTLGGPDGYARNQGVGPWEINLAAFLADLNTNEWNNALVNPYNYQRWTGLGNQNTGTAFEDAAAILRYRYNFNYNTLTAAQFLFPNNALPWRTDGINQYSHGLPFFTYGTALPPEPNNGDDPSQPWLGSDNVNHYFTTQDLFDRNKTAAGITLPVQSFVDRLTAAGTMPDTYNRYTFYRVIAQLGTDSQPERKINVNFMNVDTNGNVVPGLETNMISWGDPRITNGIPGIIQGGVAGPLLFFRTAAAEMFQRMDIHEGGDPYGRLITVTNIPIWPTNYYTPAVHRILQLAANVLESTTNTAFPCVYRPLFSRVVTPQATNVFISGYELVNGMDQLGTSPLFTTQVPLSLSEPGVIDNIALAPLQSQRNIYGIPWVIGARKGLPNLNKIAIQSFCQFTRKLEVWRPNTKSPGWANYSTRQMFIVGISNTVAVEFWNSYRTNYPSPRPVYLHVDGYSFVQVKNDATPPYIGPVTPKMDLIGNASFLPKQWPGTGIVPDGRGDEKIPKPVSFSVPLLTNQLIVPDSYALNDRLYPVGGLTSAQIWNLAAGTSLSNQNWAVIFTNNIRCIVTEGAPYDSGGRVIDYVQLSLENVRNLTAEAMNNFNSLGVWDAELNTRRQFWLEPNTVSQGILNQILFSIGSVTSSGKSANETDWSDNGLPTGVGRESAIAGFWKFLTNSYVASNVVQVPYTPTSKMSQKVFWEANDPLVHYLADDLRDLSRTNLDKVVPPNSTSFPLLYTNLWQLSDRYAPWGGDPRKSGADASAFDYMRKDPLVRIPDEWDFPTNKWPSLGWLGRVHRGTPWQTVYLKSGDITFNNATEGLIQWMTWSGDSALLPWNLTNWIADAVYSSPVTDRNLLDIFTASPNENASRAHLSINQTNLAAWSAILSGVLALTNNSTVPTTNAVVISPAGVFDPNNPPPLYRIWTNINGVRANLYLTNGLPVFVGHSFHNVGDVLAAPLLTDASPYLDYGGFHSLNAGGISDEVLERIPQQILGLLTVTDPRFVVYAYGQTLRPAPQSVITEGGSFFGLCTNYQVTAETAVRAVVRVEGTPDSQYTNSVVFSHPDRLGRFYPPRIVVEQYNVLPPD